MLFYYSSKKEKKIVKNPINTSCCFIFNSDARSADQKLTSVETAIVANYLDITQCTENLGFKVEEPAEISANRFVALLQQQFDAQDRRMLLFHCDDSRGTVAGVGDRLCVFVFTEAQVHCLPLQRIRPGLSFASREIVF